MPEVKLLLEEQFGDDRLVVDLFDQPLKLNDAGRLEATVKLAATQFELTFDKDKASFPSTAPGELAVPASARLLGDAFQAMPTILVMLQVRRDSVKAARITGITVESMEIAESGFDWGGLKVYPCKARLVLGAQPCQLILEPEGKKAASFKLLKSEFEFTETLAFSANGVRGRCEASDTTKEAFRQELRNILSPAVEVPAIHACGAVLADGSWSVSMDVAFDVRFFKGGTGELKLTASSPARGNAWEIESEVTLGNVTRWTDPYGWFQIERPGLDARFTASGDTFKSAVSLSGTFRFLPGSLDRLDPKVADWFGGLFDGISTEFDSLFDGLPKIALKPVSPFRLKALDMFQLRIPRIDVSFSSTGKAPTFSLKGIDLGLNIGDVSLRGTLPTVTFDPFEKLDIARGGDLTVDMALSAPGGVKGSGRISYKDNPLERYLEGAGQLSTPALPGVAVAFRVGQFRPSQKEDWLPTVLLYADAPAKIPLFPMVVVQRIGIGVGVNCEVRGTSRLTLAQAQKLVAAGNLPDVSKPREWIPTPHTALTLLARLFAGPIPEENVIGFYSADITLIVNSEAQAAAFGKLWLYTQTADARKEEFQQRPAALALMLLDGQEPSLRIAAQTTGNGRSSANVDGLAGNLMGFGLPSMRLAFEATRKGLLLVLGPNEMSGQLGPLSVTAKSLLAFRVAADGGTSYVMSRSSLRAVFDWRASASVGPVSLSASFNASFAADLQLLGAYERINDSSRLLIYGSASLVLNAVLALHASVGFSIRINCLFTSFTISWHVDYDFRLEVHIDLALQVALGTEGAALGLEGHATARVSVLGISASLSVPLSLNTSTVSNARSRFQQIETELREVLGS